MYPSIQSRSGLCLKALALTIAFLFTGFPASSKLSAQTPPVKDARYYMREAQKAYKEKNYSSYLELLSAAFALRPNHPTLMYNMAGAHALLGRKDEAITLLTRVANMGLIYPAEEENDFAAIKDTAGFGAALLTFKKNKAPVNTSRTAFTLTEKGLIPESVAYDPIAKTFYVGSVYRRKILSVDHRGTVKDFASEMDGLWSAFGMKVDPKRRLLWVATAAHSKMSGFKENENGSSAILKFDLTSGKLLKKYLAPADSAKHWLGDLVISAEGDVFATDSLTPAVYTIDHRKDRLDLFLKGEPFVSPQGLDFSANQRELFVADYTKGLFVIDLQTKQVTSILPATDVALLGIDGLYFHKDTLLAIQNGTNPHRVVRFFLDKSGRKITKWETLEANNPLFDEPTLGVRVKDEFYYVANSQWEKVNQKGELAPAEKLQEAVILKLKL